MIRPPPTSTPFPYTTLFRSDRYHNDIDGCHDDNYNPLRLAAADAVAMARALVKHRRFPPEKVFLLERKPPVLDQRSEEHTSELQSPVHIVCRLLLEKKKKKK